ncbi:MAG TPA: class I SAM-dependent RNA methyltransferase, partial [Phototrophicaceae bacterium]|nr:class I SAM-dependent RNA methyltransferase [Phototrophicaceae bacterium]
MTETFELDLTAMTHGGRALGRHEGRPIFVPFGIPGERVRVRITQDKRSYAFAAVEAVITPSAERVEPRCKHFGICGGCHWQQIDYAAQLRFKRDVVIEQMARIGGLRDALVHPTIASPDPWLYRSHVTFHVTSAGRLGFVAVDDRTIIPIDECYLIRPELSDWFERLKQKRFQPGERVRLQVGSAAASAAASAADKLIARSGSNAEPDDEANVASTDKVTYRIKQRGFQVTGGSFFQVNLPQAETLVDLVLNRLDLRGDERVLDLYSGVGLFTAFLAERSRRVTAVEVYAPAVRDAESNLADLSNVDFRVGTTEAVLSAHKIRVDAAVIDPPRAGMKPKALAALIACQPRKIAYVSCDPSTLARDARLLVAA